jgi:hypothetical protein
MTVCRPDTIPTTLDEALVQIVVLKESGRQSIDYYLAEASRWAREAEEQRARRLAIEEEVDGMADLCLKTERPVRYIERRVYKPMPTQAVIKQSTVVRVVKIVEEIERPARFFGRLGDKIDAFFGR